MRGRTIIWQYYSGLLASHPELHESNDGHLYFIQTLKTIGDILKQAYINHKQRLITQAQIDAQSGLLNFEDPDQWSDDEFEDVEDTNTQGTLLQVEEKLLLNDDPLDNIVVLVSDLDVSISCSGYLSHALISFVRSSSLSTMPWPMYTNKSPLAR